LNNESLAVRRRPRTIKGMIGQDAAKDVLTGLLDRARSGKGMPPSLLVTGPTGCGKWGACKTYDSGDRTDHLHEVNIGDSRGIDDIRALIKSSGYMPAFNTRIILCDEVHNATPQAAQALLKPVEDTEARTMWILATTNPEKLPAALANRCVRLPLEPVDRDILARHVFRVAKLEKFPIKSSVARFIADCSGGFVRNAMSALEAVIAAGSADRKTVESIIMKMDDVSLGMTACGFLMGYMTRDLGAMLDALTETDDIHGMIVRMGSILGYCLHETSRKVTDSDARNPYFASLDARNMLGAIRSRKRKPDVVLRRLADAAVHLSDAQASLMRQGVSDPRQIVFAAFARDMNGG